MLLDALLNRRLSWFPTDGIGYYPVPRTPSVYDARYFARYEAYADSEMGRALTEARIALVARHYTGPVVDIGIGCGQFVAARPDTRGYDINSSGIAWLQRHDRWWNPYARHCVAITMWDVLEHIHDFPVLLECVTGFVFVSLPVFDGPDEILASRHYRTDEHCWYFTPAGFLRLMRGLHWDLLEQNTEETTLGRDGIASFAFVKRSAP